MFHISNVVRSEGDPKIIEGGPSVVAPQDRLAHALGWFSIGLGMMELMAPRRITETLGMEGSESLVRAFGVREIVSGVMTLSVDKNAGLWARVGGDGLDAAALATRLTPDNPKKGNVALALLMIGGIAMLDYRTAQQTGRRRSSTQGQTRLYANRSGFPKGLPAARLRARNVTERVTARVGT